MYVPLWAIHAVGFFGLLLCAGIALLWYRRQRVRALLKLITYEGQPYPSLYDYPNTHDHVFDVQGKKIIWEHNNLVRSVRGFESPQPYWADNGEDLTDLKLIYACRLAVADQLREQERKQRLINADYAVKGVKKG